MFGYGYVEQENTRDRHQTSTEPSHTEEDDSTRKQHDNQNRDIDMGDYEQLVRPASAFWRLRDGLTMAEKIILYRNWKFQVIAGLVY